MQDLRLYDMQEALNNDRLVLAFIAEFSRGKTETINALFFSDFNQRLLPSEPGRTWTWEGTPRGPLGRGQCPETGAER